VIGGYQNKKYSGQTFYLSLEGQSWTEGPPLKSRRGYQSCGRIRKDKQSQEMSLIVAGGWNATSFMSSVEILDAGLVFKPN
jgi:hypothetical protein